jgi:hypothetical protein
MPFFSELQIIKNGKITKSKDHLKTEKGHMEELEIFIDNIKNKKNPFNEYIETTKIIVNE